MSRTHSIDTLRGFAVVLMVVGHVIGSDAAAGLQVPDNSLARYAYFSLAPIRMPLFIMLSGMVFALKPPSTVGLGRFAMSKVRRLFVPLIVVSTMYAGVAIGMERRTPDAEWLTGLWRVWFYPYQHLWFLQAILVILAVFGVAEYAGGLRTPTRAAVTLTVLSLAIALPYFTSFFSLHNAARYAPFFAVGIALMRAGDGIRHWSAVTVLTAGLLAGVVAQHYAWWSGLPTDKYVVTAVGICGCCLLVAAAPSWGPLATLGRYSLTIYLFHIFFTSATRRVLMGVGVESVPVHLAVGVVAGIAGSIVVHEVARRTAVTRVGMLGLSVRPKGS